MILALLFSSQIGHRFIYLIQQHQLKEQAEAQLISLIDDDQFEQINADDNRDNIVWEEEGKEFSLNGRLYDVGKKKIINGKTILFCLNDKKEEQLIDQMTRKEKSNADNTSNNKDRKHSIKFQLPDFTAPDQSTALLTVQIIKNYRKYTTPVLSTTKEVNTPLPNNNLYFQTLIL